MKRLLFVVLILGIVGVFVYRPQAIKETIKNPVSQTKKIITNKRNPYLIEALREREFKEGKIVVEQNLGSSGSFTSYVVSYPSDDLKIYALMHMPTTKKPEDGYPVLILNHGYINPEVYSTTQSYRRTADFYASRGYLVLKPDYRGHGQSEGAGSRTLNRINYTIDVLNLIASVPSLTNANPQQIFMWGHSMGGEITLRVIEITDKVKAATLWAPATTTFPESFIYFIRKNRPQELEKIEEEVYKLFDEKDFASISSIENLHFIKTPLIIHHGTADESVPYSWGADLDKKLNEKEIVHEFYSYQGEDHNFTRGAISQVFQRDLELFEKSLK